MKTTKELYEVADSLAASASSGCCMDAASRGRPCHYHDGYQAGMERLIQWLEGAGVIKSDGS